MVVKEHKKTTMMGPDDTYADMFEVVVKLLSSYFEQFCWCVGALWHDATWLGHFCQCASFQETAQHQEKGWQDWRPFEFQCSSRQSL